MLASCLRRQASVAAETERGAQGMQASHLRRLAPHVLPQGLLPLLPMVPWQPCLVHVGHWLRLVPESLPLAQCAVQSNMLLRWVPREHALLRCMPLRPL